MWRNNYRNRFGFFRGNKNYIKRQRMGRTWRLNYDYNFNNYYNRYQYRRYNWNDIIFEEEENYDDDDDGEEKFVE